MLKRVKPAAFFINFQSNNMNIFKNEWVPVMVLYLLMLAYFTC